MPAKLRATARRAACLATAAASAAAAVVARQGTNGADCRPAAGGATKDPEWLLCALLATGAAQRARQAPAAATTAASAATIMTNDGVRGGTIVPIHVSGMAWLSPRQPRIRFKLMWVTIAVAVTRETAAAEADAVRAGHPRCFAAVSLAVAVAVAAAAAATVAATAPASTEGGFCGGCCGGRRLCCGSGGGGGRSRRC